jgi:hypothetical protein
MKSDVEVIAEYITTAMPNWQGYACDQSTGSASAR